MMYIIVGLIVTLVIVVVVVNAIQQHKEKQEAEKRLKVAKQKAIIDETEELILNLGNLPPNPKVVEILNARCLNAAKAMAMIIPDAKAKQRVSEFEARYNASTDLAASGQGKEEAFMLPDNEQHLVAILQTIKKLRAILKSEQQKGALDAQTFMGEDHRLESMQLKINIESMLKRGNQAFAKEMIGSARQYYEKAMQTIEEYPHTTEYTQAKKQELEDKLHEITQMLKNTNEKDRKEKAKSEEDDLDMLFQPKKKW